MDGPLLNKEFSRANFYNLFGHMKWADFESYFNTKMHNTIRNLS